MKDSGELLDKLRARCGPNPKVRSADVLAPPSRRAELPPCAHRHHLSIASPASRDAPGLHALPEALLSRASPHRTAHSLFFPWPPRPQIKVSSRCRECGEIVLGDAFCFEIKNQARPPASPRPGGPSSSRLPAHRAHKRHLTHLRPPPPPPQDNQLYTSWMIFCGRCYETKFRRAPLCLLSPNSVLAACSISRPPLALLCLRPPRPPPLPPLPATRRAIISDTVELASARRLQADPLPTTIAVDELPGLVELLQFLRGTLELSERLLGPYLPLPSPSASSPTSSTSSSTPSSTPSSAAAGDAPATPEGPSDEEVARLRHPLIHWVAAVCDELEKAEAGPLEFPSLAATVRRARRRSPSSPSLHSAPPLEDSRTSLA